MNDKERIEEILKSLEEKGLITIDGENVKLTEEGVKTTKDLIENDPFSKAMWKLLNEEEEDE